MGNKLDLALSLLDKDDVLRALGVFGFSLKAETERAAVAFRSDPTPERMRSLCGDMVRRLDEAAARIADAIAGRAAGMLTAGLYSNPAAVGAHMDKPESVPEFTKALGVATRKAKDDTARTLAPVIAEIRRVIRRELETTANQLAAMDDGFAALIADALNDAA